MDLGTEVAEALGAEALGADVGAVEVAETPVGSDPALFVNLSWPAPGTGPEPRVRTGQRRRVI